MPLVSQAQQGWMARNRPDLLREYTRDMKSEDYAKLPYKKKGPEKGSLAEAAAKRRKERKAKKDRKNE